MPLLYILDNGYPFAGGEPFLKNEIESKTYKGQKVIFFPISAKKGDEKVVKENCFNVYKGMAIKHFVKALIFTIYNREFWKEVKAVCSKKKRLINFLVLLRFTFLSELKYHALLSRISKNNFEDEKQIFYAYWMHQHAYIAVRLKQAFPGSRACTRCHGYDLYEERTAGNYLPYRQYIFHNMDHIFPVSRMGKQYLMERYQNQIDEQKVIVSYLGTADFGKNIIPKGDTLYIVSCSNLIPLKRVERIIQALGKIRDIKISWRHYGDGPLRKSLELMAESTLPSNVHWNFTGYVENENILREYVETETNLFINVSSTEGLPVSIMEAMSCGIPSIATDVGGTSEIVEDNINGYLLKREFSDEELIICIKKIAAMTASEYERMRLAARRTWENKFDAQKNYTRFGELLLNS